MSRIGNNPIKVPDGVNVNITPEIITVKGRLGELNQSYSDISFDWRKDGKKFFLTDEGHYILDLKLNHIKNPALTHEKIKGVTGVVETGLFINIANKVIIGDEEGNLIEKEQG